MASYSAVIDVNVSGQEKLQKLDANMRQIQQLINGIKQQRNIFDQAVGTAEVRKAKKDLAALVEGFASAKEGARQFKATVEGKERTVNMYSKTLAGLHHQLSEFRAITDNATIGSKKFTDALDAQAKVSLELSRVQAAVLKAETQGSPKNVQATLDLSKVIPNSIAGLQLYKGELNALLATVERGSSDFAKLEQAIERVDIQLRTTPLNVPTAQINPFQYAGQAVGPFPNPASAGGGRLAQGLAAAGMPTFATGVASLGKGLAPGQRGATLKGAVGSAIIGGGFPLLFGQGPEAAIGGAAGGLLGGLIGGPMGFALSIAGTAIGEIFAKQKELTEEVRNEAIARGQVFTATQQQLDNDKLRLQTQSQINDLNFKAEEALFAGNEQLAIELQLKQELLEIDRQRIASIREKVADPNVAAGGQMAEAQQNINAESELEKIQAQRLSKLREITAEIRQQRAEVQHQAQLAQGLIQIEQQRVNATASYVQARSQAEIAVNQVILDRLNHELQSATTAQQRLRLAQEIYNVEVANAQARYTATVAQIQAQMQLAELAVKEQQIRAIQLETERAILAAKGAEVQELDRAIQKQTQAIRLAAENAGFTKQIAAEQLRGADATLQAAIQAAELRRQINGAAQGAAAYANNMQAGAAATQKAAIAATPKEPGTLAGLTPHSFMRNFQTTRNGMPFGAVSLRARAAGELGTMKDAMQTYSPTTQANTAQVNPQINVTTGPVMQMDGTNYVTQRDFTAGMQTAARQGAGMALNSLRSNPSTRRSVGLAR